MIQVKLNLRTLENIKQSLKFKNYNKNSNNSLFLSNKKILGKLNKLS
jgi:hypothetical protein